MSWQLSAFAVLAVALGSGFAWYERTHPSSKVLALVAAMAALAVAGRIAFAPLPNVKPTTDIVLLSGYALGGAPGFAVGAVTGLVSNLFFGQGPWTPWQMAAWGLVGVIGALLAATSARRLGRWPLALACGAAGLLFGAILDLSTWISFSGDHSLASYIAFSGTSLGFNLAHAIGNVVFCLAFGPALVRALGRASARLTIHWEQLAAGAVVALVLVLAALPGEARAAASPTGYLLSARNRDGGLGADRGQRSAPLYSAWAAVGLGAAGRRDPALVRYLQRTAPAQRAAGDVERTILGLRAQGASARSAGGVDLVARLLRARRADGSWGGLVNQTAFAVLALGAADTGDSRRRAGAAWIARQQNRDGGFSYARRGAASGIDDTAAALQALRAGGRARTGAVARAAAFLVRNQNADGGFPLTPRAASNAQSTAFAVQALLAAGRDPDRVRRGGSRAPATYLRTLIAADGAVRYSRSSRQTPVWVTAQVIAALARRPLPISR